MKMPSVRRLLLFIALMGALSCLTIWGSRALPAYFSKKLNVNAAEYHLPHGKLNFESLKPVSAKEITGPDGKITAYEYGDWQQFYRPLADIDPKLVMFVLQLEDAKFYTHEGFDIDEIKNSLSKNMESGKYKRGGSTITQQLAKNLFLDKKKSITRKIFEIPWALRLEKDLTKKQILELYLNAIEWGPGIHGAEAAARHFFDRPAKELEIGQALYLALIIPNPNRFDLYAHPKALEFLEKKKSIFIERLVGEKKVPPEDRETYLNAMFDLAPLAVEGRAYPFIHDGAYVGRRVRAKKPSRPGSR